MDLRRQAAALVRDDATLSSSISSAFCQALRIDENKTIGRKILRLAVEAASIEAFTERTKEFGSVQSSLITQTFRDVQSRVTAEMNRLESGDGFDEQEVNGVGGGDGAWFQILAGKRKDCKTR